MPARTAFDRCELVPTLTVSTEAEHMTLNFTFEASQLRTMNHKAIGL